MNWKKGAIESRARGAGANAFLAKPIFASTLYNTLLSVTGIEKAVIIPGENSDIHRPNLKGNCVLVVEDNEINREIATELIRKSSHPRAGTIPIIAMTADAFREDVVRAARAGMNGHLAKPIDQDLLYQKLTEILRGSRIS